MVSEKDEPKVGPAAQISYYFICGKRYKLKSKDGTVIVVAIIGVDPDYVEVEFEDGDAPIEPRRYVLFTHAYLRELIIAELPALSQEEIKKRGYDIHYPG